MGESKANDDEAPTIKHVESPLLTTHNDRGPKSERRAVFKQLALAMPIFILGAAAGMPIGYSAVLLPQLDNLNDTLKMDMDMSSWFASIHSLAAPTGSLISGMIMDYRGRKFTCTLCILPLMLGWVMLATAANHAMLLTGRVIAGFAVGLAGPPSQIFLAECAEPVIRGFLSGVPIIAYASGILFTYSLGAILHWRHVAWLGNVLPFISLCAFCFVPESPTWLARKGRLAEARSALRWLRCNDGMVEAELDDITTRMERESMQKTRSDWGLLTRAAVLKPLTIINGFHVLIIMCGTYLVVFYVVDIISDIAIDINTMHAAVYTACIRLVATVICAVLLYTVSRRSLLIGSSVIAGASCLLLVAFVYIRSGVLVKTPLDTYVPAVCMLVYIAASTTFMMMPGVMIGELLPARIRGQVGGLIFCGFHVCFFFVAKWFPYFAHVVKTQGVFLLFGGASMLTALFIGVLMPETKGRTLGQIEDYFQGDNWVWARRPKGSK